MPGFGRSEQPGEPGGRPRQLSRTTTKKIKEEHGTLGDWTRLGQLLSEYSLAHGSGDPTPECKVLYCALSAEAVIWFFFGDDGSGFFNKLGCKRGFGLSSLIAGTAELGGCDADAAVGWPDFAKHLSVFFALVVCGPVTLHALRSVTRRSPVRWQRQSDDGGWVDYDAEVSESLEKGRQQWEEGRRAPELIDVGHGNCVSIGSEGMYSYDPLAETVDRTEVRRQHHGQSGQLEMISKRFETGADEDDIQQVFDGLKPWRKVVLGTIALLVTGCASATVLELAIGVGWARFLKPFRWLTLGVCFAVVGCWWLTMLLAVAMSKVHVTHVAKQVDALKSKALKSKGREPQGHAATLRKLCCGCCGNSAEPAHSYEPLEERQPRRPQPQPEPEPEPDKKTDKHTSEDWGECWTTRIEEPALKLATQALPALSSGWGFTVGALMAALTSLAVSEFVWLASKPAAAWEEYRLGLWVEFFFAIVVAFIPIWFASQPAGVSNACHRLLDSLTDLRLQSDTGHLEGTWRSRQERMKPLHDVLMLANGRQGIGFRVGPVVLSTGKLLAWVGTTYAVVEGLCMLLLEVSDHHENTFVVGVDRQCPSGWSSVEGNMCFKLFSGEAERTSWHAAEAVCQEYNGHLASVTSQEQQDAVASLIEAASVSAAVWIGLRSKTADATQHTKDTFAWTDGEAMEFAHWSPGEPDNSESEECPASYGAQDCGFVGNGHGWYDAQCNVTSYADQAESLPGLPGCYPAHFPFICSKAALPDAATGGDMNGCLHGRWVLGRAHGDPSLPATTNAVANTSLARTEPTGAPALSAAEVRARTPPFHCRSLTSAACGCLQCMAQVRTNFPEANAAQYSNVGKTSCSAVYAACAPPYAFAAGAC